MKPSDPANTERVLQFLQAYWAQNHISPTYREIADALIWSTDRVFREVRKLARAGKVTVSDRTFRGIVPVDLPPPSPAPPQENVRVEPCARAVPVSARYRCQRCHIRIGAVTGLCEDCAEKKPLIQYANAMGAERFYQTSRPRKNIYALAYEKADKPERRGRTPRRY